MATSWYEQNCPPDSTFGGEGSTVLDTLTVLAVGAGIGAVAMHYLHATNRMGPTTIRDLKHRILGQYNQDRDTIPEVYYKDGSKAIIGPHGVMVPDRRDWHPWRK